MKKIDWKYVSSELVEVLLLVEEEEEVIKRLLEMIPREELESLGWFHEVKIDEVIENEKAIDELYKGVE